LIVPGSPKPPRNDVYRFAFFNVPAAGGSAGLRQPAIRGGRPPHGGGAVMKAAALQVDFFVEQPGKNETKNQLQRHFKMDASFCGRPRKIFLKISLE
jgi:hypothetical protein